jgi:hypothetical protein
VLGTLVQHLECSAAVRVNHDVSKLFWSSDRVCVVLSQGIKMVWIRAGPVEALDRVGGGRWADGAGKSEKSARGAERI